MYSFFGGLLKYLFLILLLLPVRFSNYRKKGRYRILNQEQEYKMEANNDEKPLVTTKLKVVKNLIGSYVDSFEKLLFYKVKYIPSRTVRNFVYRRILLVDVERSCIIYYGREIRAGYNLHIGKGSVVGDNCIIDAGGVIIGKNVNISSEVRLWTGSHDINDPHFSFKSGSICINDRAWISSNAIFLGNVNIGEGAVVCANAGVTKDVEPFTVVAGVPAKTNRNKK